MIDTAQLHNVSKTSGEDKRNGQIIRPLLICEHQLSRELPGYCHRVGKLQADSKDIFPLKSFERICKISRVISHLSDPRIC